MTFALTRFASSSVARRAVASRQLSTVPKMHKAKDLWPAMMELRPTDPDDHHVSFYQ